MSVENSDWDRGIQAGGRCSAVEGVTPTGGTNDSGRLA